MLLSDNTFLIFDLDKLALSDWSEKNSNQIPATIKSAAGPLEGIVFDPTHSNRIFLHGQGVFVFVDLDLAVPSSAKTVNPVLLLPAALGVGAEGDATNTRGVGGGVLSGAHAHTTSGVGKKRRKEKEAGNGPNFATVKAYRSLVHMGCLEGSQLVSFCLFNLLMILPVL